MRRRYIDGTCNGHGHGGHDGEERYTVQGGACARCGWAVTPSGPGLKSHRDFLSPRTPEAKWLRTCNPYSGWKLWRDWTPPKPVKVESSADTRKRERTWLRTASPYSWRCEKLTPEQRLALGCLPKPAVRARPTSKRAAA